MVSNMSFVNEFISADDVEKYGLKAIDEKFIVGGTNSRQWTIDRDRGIYLRNVARGGGAEPEIRNQTKWSFFWGDELLTLRLDLIDGGGETGGMGWSQWKLVRVNGSEGLPESLKGMRGDFLESLKEALITYRSAGAYSRDWSSYQVQIEIDGGCVL
jgi:hypothetical protein